MYIMFPIAIMYYFGTNLDEKFAVPGFWPSKEQTNRIPFEREEIKAELERQRAKRLWLREKRLNEERAKAENSSGGSTS
jgi:protein PET100